MQVTQTRVVGRDSECWIDRWLAHRTPGQEGRRGTPQGGGRGCGGCRPGHCAACGSHCTASRPPAVGRQHVPLAPTFICRRAAGQLGRYQAGQGGRRCCLLPLSVPGTGDAPNSYLFDVLRVLLGDELEKQDKKLGETREAPASPASGNPRKFPGLSSQLPPTLTWPYPAPRGQWPLVPGCPGFQPLSATLGDVSARASVSSETWKAP